MRAKSVVSETLLVLLCRFAGASVAAEPAVVNVQGRADAVQNHAGHGKWMVVMVWSTACVTCQWEIAAVNAYNAGNAEGRVHVRGLAINGNERK